MTYDPGKKRAYYQANREKILGQRREYNKSHRQKRAESGRQWNSDNREYIYANSLKRYGLTPESRSAIEEAQGGLCKICKEPQRDSRKSKLCVDHCHNTGKIRGLLCSNCNAGLGQFRDRPDLLRAAAKYLTDQQLDHPTEDGHGESA